ncbi:MAG: helix-turn-helix transcriptional regulator [Bacteroidota bacterium]
MEKAQQAIGKRIRVARVAADIKQYKAAEAINMSLSNYQKIEGGFIGVSAVVLSELTRLFSTSADILLDIPPTRLVTEPESKYLTALEIEGLKGKIALLEQSLADKDEIIDLLKYKLANPKIRS